LNQRPVPAVPSPALPNAPTPVRADGLPTKAFGEVFPENVPWGPFPAFPPLVRLAVLVGDTTKPEPYVIRVKVPADVRLMPHTHPEDRVYTVISGVFYIGIGTEFEPDGLRAYPPGSVVVLPGNTPHFHWAKSGEYVTQVTAIGPLGLVYADPGDDPREVLQSRGPSVRNGPGRRAQEAGATPSHQR
jgi:quercetin dioxygenase-like cupin family protein